MGVCTRNMSRYECVNKITLLHQVGISNYFHFNPVNKASMVLGNGGTVPRHSPEVNQVFIFKSLFLLQLTGIIFPAPNFPNIF
jgi:hypothetical protein